VQSSIPPSKEQMQASFETLSISQTLSVQENSTISPAITNVVVMQQEDKTLNDQPAQQENQQQQSIFTFNTSSSESDDSI